MTFVDVENKNKIYKLNNFIVYEMENRELVVMHNKGIVKVTESRLIECIKNWDLNGTRQTSDKYITSIFVNDGEAVTKFLIDNSIIVEEITANYFLKEMVFLSNCQKVLSLASQTFFEESNLISTFESIDTVSINKEWADNTLYVVFLNPYNKKLAKSIRDSIKQSTSSILLMSYVYNNNFYIDSFYLPSMFNPCHLCHIGHIESQLRIDSTGNVTYQQIIDSIYYEEPNFSIHTVLSRNNILNIVSNLSNKVAKFVTRETGNLIYPEEMHECTMLDLQTNRLYVDYSIHWELCDCYEQ